MACLGRRTHQQAWLVGQEVGPPLQSQSAASAAQPAALPDSWRLGEHHPAGVQSRLARFLPYCLGQGCAVSTHLQKAWVMRKTWAYHVTRVVADRPQVLWLTGDKPHDRSVLIIRLMKTTFVHIPLNAIPIQRIPRYGSKHSQHKHSQHKHTSWSAGCIQRH